MVCLRNQVLTGKPSDNGQSRALYRICRKGDFVTGIYKISNIKNGNFYIGQSKNIERRFRVHMWDKNRKQGTTHSPLFSEDLNNYEKECFKLEVLEECDPDRLLERERYYIDKLNPPYNSVKRKREEDFCIKVREGNKKWWNNLPEETKEKIIKGNLTHRPEFGHEVSEATRNKISKSLTGKIQTEETKKKRAEALRNTYKIRGKKPTYGHRKKVNVRYPDGTVEIFASAIDAAKKIGCSDKYIYKLIREKRHFKGIDIWYEV